jgi:hypothetical protein
MDKFTKSLNIDSIQSIENNKIKKYVNNTISKNFYNIK